MKGDDLLSHPKNDVYAPNEYEDWDFGEDGIAESAANALARRLVQDWKDAYGPGEKETWMQKSLIASAEYTIEILQQWVERLKERQLRDVLEE